MIYRSVLIALFLMPFAASAEEWALDGMDPVSFFERGAPVPGRSDLVTKWRGDLWHFSSERHRAMFEANPKAYAPAFDGICPVSLYDGHPEAGDPRYFVVYKERLYLLDSAQSRARFVAAPDDVLATAQRNFSQLAH